MQFKRIKRPVDGVLLLDKPAGLSSNQALQQVKRLYQAEKAGHTGSLDPFATGLLPVCFGEATKFSHFLLDADKTYHATLRLGATSTTGDTEGEITELPDRPVTQAAFEHALTGFQGVIRQVPPMYSALKYQGKALYEYARAGQEIERTAREVTVYRIELMEFGRGTAKIFVSCSKGTYIRTLAEDIGKRLGGGAYLTALRRVGTGGFELESALTIPQIEAIALEQRDAVLLETDLLLRHLPGIELDQDGARHLRLGQAVRVSGHSATGLLRLYDDRKNFLGLGLRDADGRIAPKRLLKAATCESPMPEKSE